MKALPLILAALVMTSQAVAAYDLKDLIQRATPGDTITVPAGVHPGTITIDKPLTLVGEPGAIIEGVGEGDVVRIKAPDVTLRNLTIRRTGDSLERENAGILVTAPRARIEDCTLSDVLFGIYLKNAPESIIRSNRIGSKPLDIARRGDVVKIWYSDGAIVENNTIHDGRDLVMWYSRGLVVRGNDVRRCRYGVHFMFAGDATVEDNRLFENSVGIFLMYSEGLILKRNVIARNRGPSGYGLGLKDIDRVDVSDNTFVDNRVGMHIDNSPSRYDVRHLHVRNVFAYNDIALSLMPNDQGNDFVDNTFHDNVEQVAIVGGYHTPRENQFTVAGRGNYWSDYRGYDRDGDGVGDLPYTSSSLFENLVQRQPRLRLFLFSPAQQAIELASRAFPTVKPSIRAVDHAPRMTPLAHEIAPTAGGWSWTMFGWGMLLLGASGVIAVLGVRPIGGVGPHDRSL